MAVPMALVQFAEPALGRDGVAVLDNASWLLMMLSPLGAVALLAFRASRRSDRRALRPLLLGSALGVGPLVGLVAVPRLLGFQGGVAPEMAAVAMVAIPASFAYSILRHQVFGLDVLVRRVLLRISNALVGVVLFLACWVVLQAVGLPSTETPLVSPIVAGCAMPSGLAWAPPPAGAWPY